MGIRVLMSVLALVAVLAAAVAEAHPDAVDDKGCHFNRKLRDYHCH